MRDASGARIGEYWLDGELPPRGHEIAYRATHRVLPRCARIAILNPELIGVRPAELQLLREACVLEALHHLGVPRVFECGVLERRPWVATEHVDGASIEQASAERPLPIADAIAVVRDAAAVLAHAHQRGVVHTHLTPRAILRTPSRGFPLCITEWGHAVAGADAVPQPAEAAARFYRAPELAVGGPVDGRADVFSLGFVMYEAATLVLPERRSREDQEEALEQVQKFPGMPESFHLLLASMLARFPDERPTAAAVHAQASRLAELYSDSDGQIEEVEVELVDIASTATALPSLGWMPSEQIAGLSVQALGSMRRRNS